MPRNGIYHSVHLFILFFISSNYRDVSSQKVQTTGSGQVEYKKFNYDWVVSGRLIVLNDYCGLEMPSGHFKATVII